MKIPVKSVQTLAIEAGLPESVVERHIDALCHIALAMRERERRWCKNRIRRWYFDKALNKPQLFEALED